MSLLPNTLTVIRILLVLPIGWTLWTGHFEACLLLLVIAGVSDLLDGFVARQFNSISRFGELADPIADKLLALVVVGVMSITGLLPLWAATHCDRSRGRHSRWRHRVSISRATFRY